MNARNWSFAAALCLAAATAGCKSDSGHTPDTTPTAPTVTLTASDASVIANGVNTVTLSVTDGGGSGPIQFTTTRGTFSGGGTTTSIAGATGTVTLVTCNASTVSTCAGTAVVTATGPSGSDSVSIVFGSLASVCPSNCSADPGCAGSACTLTGGGAGSCSATTPSVCTAAPACTRSPAGASSETSCSDGTDNDCNGKTDCAESSCAGQQCGALATSVCKSGACVDLSSGLSMRIVPVRTRLPADGTTSTTIRVALTSALDPVPNLGVTLSLTPAGFGTLSATTGTSDLNGNVFVTYTAPATPGSAVITATVTLIPTVTGFTTITMPRFGALQVPDPYAAHLVMGAKTSGWNEFSPVMVQALDDQGMPYPDGLAVRFEHRTFGGSTFGPPLAATNLGACTAAAGCVAYDGVVSSGPDPAVIDTTGLASAPLFAGTVAGTLVVRATATASGVTRTVTLPSVAVVGAKASLSNFSVMCAPRNVPALAEHDCSVSWVDAPFTCAALVKDRFNNLLGIPTQVIFASEAAAVGQVTWTPPYDPTILPNDQTVDLGTATQIFETLGAGLPFDVDPQPGEQFVSHALDGCGVRTHNPRDGVVTIIAIADGEEGFFDANGNGQYDAGEPFVDQGEPFIDQDDNGQWDPGEWFLDVDGGYAYTPPNGLWDAQTKIWTQTVVVYTGWPAGALAKTATTYLGTRWVDAATPFANGCTPTPAPALFSVENGLSGLPPTLPTSTTYGVVASDMNLNVLTKNTTYDAKPATTVKSNVEYLGLASYADLLGLFYQYWPCDQAGSCASQCRATGANAPCKMKPAISGYWCGIDTAVRVTGGTTEADGLFGVNFSVDTPWSNYGGEAKILHQVVQVGGYSDRNPATPPP